MSNISFRLILLILSIFILSFCSAQNNELSFCKHLYAEKKFNELSSYSDYLLENYNKLNIDTTSRDSIEFLKLKTKLMQKEYEFVDKNNWNNIAKLEGVNPLLFYCKLKKSIFLSDSLWNSFHQHSRSSQTDLNFFRCIELLHRKDYLGCEKLAKESEASTSDFRYKILFTDVLKLVILKNNLIKKSPIKAALISTIAPGLGKKYVGYNGETVSAITTNGILALSLAEAIWRKKLKNPYTIGIGVVFSTFYIGNITGSYYAAKRLNFQNERILYVETEQIIDSWAKLYL